MSVSTVTATPTVTPTAPGLTPEQAAGLARELDALRREIETDLGQRDVAHIRQIMRAVTVTEGAGRLLLHFGLGPLSFVVGTGALSVAKILENMEVGHNVMHGQYDWTGDPDLDSKTYEWDNVCAGDDWRHYHNYEHHTFTNIVGQDRDVGYMFLRVCPEQPWTPAHRVQPLSALLLALAFEWGVGMHGLRVAETVAGEQSLAELRARSKAFVSKAGWQLLKDYGFFPALAGLNAPRVLLGNLLANGARNLWTFSVIFCGHFPDGVRFYTPEQVEGESRGEWYARQLNGSANIEGGRLFHIMTGHLSHQIEHHLFPDLPASRYPEVAPRVRDICERYGQAYPTGSFARQLSSVGRRILKLSRPTGSSLSGASEAG